MQDLDTVIAAQARYLNTLSQYKDFSKKMKLPEPDGTSVYGWAGEDGW